MSIQKGTGCIVFFVIKKGTARIGTTCDDVVKLVGGNDTVTVGSCVIVGETKGDQNGKDVGSSFITVGGKALGTGPVGYPLSTGFFRSHGPNSRLLPILSLPHSLFDRIRLYDGPVNMSLRFHVMNSPAQAPNQIPYFMQLICHGHGDNYDTFLVGFVIYTGCRLMGMHAISFTILWLA